MWSLSFGATNSSFNVLPLLKCTWMPNFLPMFLKLSLSPLLYGTVTEVLLVLLLLFCLLLFLFCFGVFFFNFILCMAHEGYLHTVSALSTYVNSSFNWSWLEQMLVALCNKELITLYLLAIEWWSQISRIGESLCLLKNIFCYRENQFQVQSFCCYTYDYSLEQDTF